MLFLFLGINPKASAEGEDGGKLIAQAFIHGNGVAMMSLFLGINPKASRINPKASERGDVPALIAHGFIRGNGVAAALHYYSSR